MASSSLVSVIIPAYNAESFIGQTLNSVLEQTYQDFEIIVVDDGSSDRTAEIVAAYDDPRIQLLRQQNAGVAAARNLAIQASKGVYLAPLDADDIWYPQKLEKQVRCLESADETVGLVYAWSIYLNETGDMIGQYADVQDFTPEDNLFNGLLYCNFLDNASTPLFRRSCIDRVGGYNCDLKAQNAQGCEDWDLYLRIAAPYEIRVVPEYLIGYRQYVGSMATNSPVMAKSYELMMREAQQRHPNIPDRIRRWSSGRFYNYLISKSFVCRDYQNMFGWIVRCVRIDPIVLLRPALYKVILFASFDLITRPLKKDRQKVQRSSQTIAQVNPLDRPTQPPLWKLYDRVQLWRWQQILQMPQISNH